MLNDKSNKEGAGDIVNHSAKLRADSNWSGLSSEQYRTLERWLFQDNLSYRETLERARKEFGIEASPTSLQRFRRRILKEEAIASISEAEESAEEVKQTRANLANLRSSGWLLVGKQFLEKAIEGCDIKELRLLGRLMAESEEREIRRARVGLAREKFEFNAVKEVLKKAALFERMKKEDQEREDAKMDAIRLEIFGTPPPWYKPYEEGGC